MKLTRLEFARFLFLSFVSLFLAGGFAVMTALSVLFLPPGTISRGIFLIVPGLGFAFAIIGVAIYGGVWLFSRTRRIRGY